ncbi:MAG: peptidylprolyl isomerase [Candidatus Azotimanducaceae bacterium]|uniref:Chaperone SurA n=1 Tax=OM182 bacterium TaxID=2510334 RepID=A0A520S3M6_9GAMM|nr:MAG: molecular chaperone SurA [OM182 bacterium]
MNRTIILLLLIIGFAKSHAKPRIIDRIAVVIDEKVITNSEITERVQLVRSTLLADKNRALPTDEILVEQIIERLILEHLQLQIADRAGLRISDSELNQTLQSIAMQNNLDLTDFRMAVEADGQSYPRMREQVKREMIINQVQQGFVQNRIAISEQELKNFLESNLGKAVIADEYRLAHILIASPEKDEGSTSTLKAEALTLISRSNAGEKFETLARQYSAGQNAANGGDLGWRKPIQLPTIFADLVSDMEKDELRGPIKSGSGFHIIKLIDRRGAKAEGNVEQTRARHVLIKPSEIRSNTEARELAENLRNEVLSGKTFEEIAKINSEDPGSALSGGDLGWSVTDIYVPEFEAMLKSMELNIISPVFKTTHGYHFLEVTGKRIEDFSNEYQKNMAENYLRSQKFDDELDVWLREIREDAFVDIRI